MSQTTPIDEPLKDEVREQRLVELVKLDYDVALRAVTGFVGTGAQLRAIGAAAWGLVLGLAIDNRSASLGALALAITLIFAHADAYHAALYRRALARAIRLETLLDEYANRLGIDADDEDAVLEIRAKLEMHRFGMYRSLSHPRWQEYLRGRPRVVFRVVYPMLALSSLVAVVWFI